MKRGKQSNIFAKSLLKKRGVALNVPMMSRREFFKPHKATHPFIPWRSLHPQPKASQGDSSLHPPPMLLNQPALLARCSTKPQLTCQVNGNMVVNHGLTVVGEYKMHYSGQALVSSCLDALMEGVDVPKGYSILYTDAFGYDGCLASVVLKANARDPGTARSCVTICQEQDYQSYVTNLVGTSVFSMGKTRDIDVPDFPDLQHVVETCRQPTLDQRLTLKLDATVYLPGPRVLAVLERHVHRWSSDPIKGEVPRT